MLNRAAFAPIPSARDSSVMVVNPGLFARDRHRVAHVLAELVDDLGAPRVAAFLLALLDASERAQRGVAGLLRGHAPAMSASIRRSRWSRISSSRSCSTWSRRKSERRRSASVASRRMPQASFRRTTRVIAPDRRSQFAASRSRACRPARVSE